MTGLIKHSEFGAIKMQKTDAGGGVSISADRLTDRIEINIPHGVRNRQAFVLHEIERRLHSAAQELYNTALHAPAITSGQYETDRLDMLEKKGHHQQYCKERAAGLHQGMPIKMGLR